MLMLCSAPSPRSALSQLTRGVSGKFLAEKKKTLASSSRVQLALPCLHFRSSMDSDEDQESIWSWDILHGVIQNPQ